MLGLVVGVVKEEPELVMGHLAGQSEEVRWSEHDTGLGTPDVGAAGPYAEPIAESEAYELAPPTGNDGFDAGVAAAEDTASRPAYEAAPPEPVRTAVRAAPAPAPRAAPSASAGQGFSVQVGAFAESEAAERVASDLRGKGFPVYVSPKAGSRDGRWRVRVGPVASRGKADEIAQQLKTREGLPTWVLSEGGG
jgi:cell division septation protein DedD